MRVQSIGDALNPMASLSLSAPHRVLVVGCAYGGVSAVVNLRDLIMGKPRQGFYEGSNSKRRSRRGVEITVIDERDGYFHSVGAPLAHVAPKHTTNMWKRFSHLNELRHPNVHFKHGSVKNIDPESKVAEWLDRNGRTQHQAYDYLIMATGLRRHWPAVPRSGSYQEYIKDSEAFISKIVGGDPSKPQAGRRVVIIGAGAVGVEFAGEIKNYYPSLSVTLVHSRQQVLSSEPLPDDVKARATTMLEEEGVELVLGGGRASISEMPNGQNEITLANGTKLTADFVIDATKKGSATTECLPQDCLNKDQEILVNQNLSFKSTISNASSHYAVGDVIEWSGIKRAGSAMVMGQTAAFNIYASILNSELPSTATEEDKFSPIELPRWPAVIGLAVGKQCLTYDESSGIKWGVEVMKGYFGDDLGWAANLKYLGLTDVIEGEDQEKLPEKVVQIGEVGVEPVTAAA